MKFIVFSSILLLATIAPATANATDNRLIVDQYLSEISEDKTRLDELYKEESVALVFGTCFDKLNIRIFGARNAPGDYKKFGKTALSKPYTDFARPLFIDNTNDLARLKTNREIESGEIIDAMERYRVAVRDVERQLDNECMLWAKRDKWNSDHGIDVPAGSSFTEEHKAIAKTSPYITQFYVQPTKLRHAALERAGAVRPFSRIGSNAPTNRPATIAELVTELQKHMSPTGPTLHATVSERIDAQSLQKFKANLESLYLHPNDWAYLIDTHFYASGQFDPSKWPTFVDFSLRSGFSASDQDAAAKLDRALSQNLKVPQPAIDLLRAEFFKSKTLRRLSVSDNYGGNYQYYVLDKLFHRPKAFDSALSEKSRKLLETLKDSSDSTPKMPVMRAALPGEGKRDCSWNAVVARMKAADPSFAQKWNQYFIMGTIMSSFGPGGPAGTSGSGHAFKRSVLVAGVREAIKLCESGKT